MFRLKRKKAGMWDYKTVEITRELINKYKSKDNMLFHARFVKGLSSGYMLLTPRDELIGYIIWEVDFIVAFEVINKYQKSGYGKILLAMSIIGGANKLSVNKNNKLAINFCIRSGFEIYKDGRKMLFMKLKEEDED